MNCQVTAESVREWFKADASVLQCQPIEAIIGKYYVESLMSNIFCAMADEAEIR
jgi:hypothetical protein